ncbi:MAG: Cytochrome c [Gemmataceae bacterium]|nr:Cytochrome c [Gemmataceae bacterium]
MSHLFRLFAALPVFILGAVLVASAVPPDGAKDDKSKPKAAAKGSPEETLAQVQVEKGLKVEVWASEPLMQNPVAFCFDEQGRAYVAETNRLHTGVPDTRGHMNWLDEDLACRTSADRVAMYKKHNYTGFEKYSDQVRMVFDSTGSGKADKSTVFSAGYNRPEDGLAAGVLARKGTVYLANIPDLYALRDTKGEGKADEKKSLFTGFGPTAQFIGHDLHGLRMGPDGKLYFSIGDRGFNVTTKEGKQLLYPNTGAVLRCDPDGANLEVVHYGLRNPQELAFDDSGNLFTFDNNSDSGDRARWVYIVEGGDSGWRGGYQYGTLYHPPGVPQGNRGPWNAEKIWHVPGPDGGPPAYVVPPLAHFGNGPAGMTHYPGVGLNDKYKDHFFACDFTASPGGSVIWSVAVKPKGASFEVAKHEPFVRGMVPTDCEFGPDGAFYWSDWVGGWDMPRKGRIFKLTDPEAMKNPAVGEARKLIAEGFGKKTADELEKLLEHPHQQVRLDAQYELVHLKADGRLAKVAKGSSHRLARLHAIWGLGMIARKHHPRIARTNPPGAVFTLAELARHDDAEVRAQALKVLGALPLLPRTLRPVVLKDLADPEPRVKYFAAIAYGKLDWLLTSRLPVAEIEKYLPLFELLKANNDQDAYLRHAAVVTLEALAVNPVDLWNVWTRAKDKYDVQAVRLGVLLALRRHKSDKVGEFLKDPDPKIADEAARAVHDERIEGAMAKLAELADSRMESDPVAYRALSANFKLGTPAAAARVAKVAARPSDPDHVRVFALKLLADWANPPRRDPITGLIHDLPKRDGTIAADALKPVIAGAFSGSDAVRSEAAQVSAKLGIKEVGPLLTELMKDARAPASTRAEALYALAAVKDPGLAGAAQFALSTTEPRLRAAGLAVKAKLDPDAVLKVLPGLLKDEKVSAVEKQAGLAALGRFGPSVDVDELLAGWLDAAVAGTVPPELVLDVLDAAEARTKTPNLKLLAPLGKKVDAYRTARAKSTDKLAPWADTLAGGDAEKGWNILLNNNAVYCQRCHKLDGQGGEVGPPLNGIAGQMGKDRRYLLESVVMPSAQIARGYETVILSLADGRTVSGVVKEDTKKQIKLLTPEGKELLIPADEVEARRTGPSAMPDDLHKKLSHRELRDLVEFLASLKDPEKKGGP